MLSSSKMGMLIYPSNRLFLLTTLAYQKETSIYKRLYLKKCWRKYLGFLVLFAYNSAIFHRFLQKTIPNMVASHYIVGIKNTKDNNFSQNNHVVKPFEEQVCRFQFFFVLLLANQGLFFLL